MWKTSTVQKVGQFSIQDEDADGGPLFLWYFIIYNALLANLVTHSPDEAINTLRNIGVLK